MLINAGMQIKDSKILILGFTFKENCPDTRNTKVIDVYRELKEFGVNVDVYDYEADPVEVREEYGINLIDKINTTYSGIMLTVAHKKFASIELDSIKENSRSVFRPRRSAKAVITIVNNVPILIVARSTP